MIAIEVLNRRPFVEVLSEQFLWFLKTYLLWFHHICLLFVKSNLSIFQMGFIRRTNACMCPSMTNVDVVDFSEGCSKEVIRFFWRSMYIDLMITNLNESLWDEFHEDCGYVAVSVIRHSVRSLLEVLFEALSQRVEISGDRKTGCGGHRLPVHAWEKIDRNNLFNIISYLSVKNTWYRRLRTRRC